MSNLLTKAFQKAQCLPEHIQDQLAEQFIEDIEMELKWQQTLSQPESAILEELAEKALRDSLQGKTKVMGFDEL